MLMSCEIIVKVNVGTVSLSQLNTVVLAQCLKSESEEWDWAALKLVDRYSLPDCSAVNETSILTEKSCFFNGTIRRYMNGLKLFQRERERFLGTVLWR